MTASLVIATRAGSAPVSVRVMIPNPQSEHGADVVGQFTLQPNEPREVLLTGDRWLQVEELPEQPAAEAAPADSTCLHTAREAA